MVSLSRAFFAASVALAAAIGTSASLQDDTAVAHHKRAFGKSNQLPRLVSRFGTQPQRRARRCKPKAGKSASAHPSSIEHASSSSRKPLPQHHSHIRSQSSSQSPSPSPSQSRPQSHSRSESHSPSKSHSESQAQPSPQSHSHSSSSSPKPWTSSTGGNHYATSASSSWAPAPSSSHSSSSSDSSSGGSSGGIGGILSGAAAGTHTGDLTYYNTGLGACGWQSSDTDYIAAIGTPLWTQYGFSNSNKLCGHEISVTYNGKNIKVKAVDQCPGCAAGSLDLSPAAFKALGDEAQGRLTGATWHFIS